MEFPNWTRLFASSYGNSNSLELALGYGQPAGRQCVHAEEQSAVNQVSRQGVLKEGDRGGEAGGQSRQRRGVERDPDGEVGDQEKQNAADQRTSNHFHRVGIRTQQFATDEEVRQKATVDHRHQRVESEHRIADQHGNDHSRSHDYWRDCHRTGK